MFCLVRKKFERVHILIDAMDEQHQGDLLDARWFARFNNEVKSLRVAEAVER